MRRKNTQMTTNILIVSLLLIGVVYAILQANLQINGTAKIQANTWDIHFDNIQVNENSVSIGTGDSAATIDSENNCKVDFEVTLSIPGDFYEFTIDVVNAGTIDGMIGELNKTLKVNNEVVQETPDYLNYSVTYADDMEILENHKLSADTTETYKVRLEFKSDIEELPQATSISTSLEPQFIQADSSARKVVHLGNLYKVLQTEANNGGYAKEYTGNHKDSFTEPATEKIYHWYANVNTDGSIIQNKNNIIFAGFCWQILRTTDTGGIKIIYNGVPSNNKCPNTNRTRTITGKSNNYSSLSNVGYKTGSQSLRFNAESPQNVNYIFGKDFDYENGVYYLTDTVDAIDNYHHYSCRSNETSCDTMYYYYHFSSFWNSYYYVQISDGKNISQIFESVFSEEKSNKSDSETKKQIDTWYQNNLLSYSTYFEDTIFCDDRTIKNMGGWNPNGGNLNQILEFKNYGYTNKDLSCERIVDQLCLSNAKANLKYPIAMATGPEIKLLNYDSAISSGDSFWFLSPSHIVRGVNYLIMNGSDLIYYPYTLRPVVSLKSTTNYISGDGSQDNPYIIE